MRQIGINDPETTTSKVIIYLQPLVLIANNKSSLIQFRKRQLFLLTQLFPYVTFIMMNQYLLHPIVKVTTIRSQMIIECLPDIPNHYILTVNFQKMEKHGFKSTTAPTRQNIKVEHLSIAIVHCTLDISIYEESKAPRSVHLQ